MVISEKKLLVLDINGLLLDTYFEGEARPDRPHDAKVNRFYVYKRAFCEEFIQFSLQNFIVGVWSSAREHNVLSLVDYMFKEAKEKLAFIWHQQHCTDTGLRHPDNKYKPVFLKELSKLWEKIEADLPWAKGDYGPSNTLLIDDSPYKAISNPRHTAIFPKTYKATEPDDTFLAGELLPYLDGLLKARDVQKFVQRNPIGESSISPSDPQWSQILKSDLFKNEEELAVPAHLMAISAPVRPNFMVSSNQWMRPNSLMPANGGAVPQLVGAESQSWNAGHRDKRWKRSDRTESIPQLNGDYHGGTDDSQGYMRDFHQRGPGPSWSSRHTSRETSGDLLRKHAMLSRRSSDYGHIYGDDLRRKHAMLSRRSSDYGDISGGPDSPYNDFHNHKRHDTRTSFRDYGSRTSGWSEEPEDFRRGESWDFRRGGARDQEGRRTSSRDYGSRASGWSEEPEDFGRGDSWDFRRGGARDQEGSHQVEGKRKRRVDWTRDPRGVPLDEQHVIRTRERSRDRELEEPIASRFQQRSSPRLDYRRDESQFQSKPRYGRDFQRYAEKELPRKRDLSADSGRHSQRNDHSFDGVQRRSRRKTGKNRTQIPSSQSPEIQPLLANVDNRITHSAEGKEAMPGANDEDDWSTLERIIKGMGSNIAALTERVRSFNNTASKGGAGLDSA